MSYSKINKSKRREASYRKAVADETKEKEMSSKEFAIAYAAKLVADYPAAKNVQDLMEAAMQDGRFENKTEMLSVWGRVNRLLPQKETK